MGSFGFATLRTIWVSEKFRYVILGFSRVFDGSFDSPRAMARWFNSRRFIAVLTARTPTTGVVVTRRRGEMLLSVNQLSELTGRDRHGIPKRLENLPFTPGEKGAPVRIARGTAAHVRRGQSGSGAGGTGPESGVIKRGARGRFTEATDTDPDHSGTRWTRSFKRSVQRSRRQRAKN